nr:MAG TPA: hypothetical protein [Caudoviricetes sp.]
MHQQSGNLSDKQSRRHIPAVVIRGVQCWTQGQIP